MFEILLLISLLAVIGVAKQIYNQHQCPEETVLKDVVLGRIKKDGPVGQHVIRHLGVCKKCQKIVIGLNDD